VTILTGIGYFIGEKQELIMRYSHQAVILVILSSAVIIAVYIWIQRRRKRS
jgi:membrane protein DedA with SNARE-associated domain